MDKGIIYTPKESAGESFVTFGQNMEYIPVRMPARKIHSGGALAKRA